MKSETLQQRANEAWAEDPRVVPMKASPAALAFIRASGWFGSFIHQAWRSYPWSERFFLKHYLKPGHCLGLVEKGRLRAMGACLIDPAKGEGSVPFFDAEDTESAGILLEVIERRFANAGVPCATAIIPPGGSRAMHLLDALGWNSWERQEDYLVYEFPLDRLEEYRRSN